MAESKKSGEPVGEETEVVDRRRITPEGKIRPEVAAQQVPEKPSPKAESSREMPRAESQQAEKAYESRRPRNEAKMDFRALVLSLSTTAMYQLGLVAEGGAPPPQPDFEAARQTIDLLAALEAKTRNNLSAEEKQLLEQALYELRMSYVALGRK